jgi:hypothetical protein
MAETKTKKKKKTAQGKGPRLEWRFEPDPMRMSLVSAIVGIAAAAVLGAGVFGQWFHEPANSFAPALLVVGAVGVVGALFMAGLGTAPVRVGDPGVAVERPSDTLRVPWCDMEHIRIERGALTIETHESSLRIPLAMHQAAVARVLAEAVVRAPDAMDVKGDAVETLPKPSDDDGKRVPIEMLQIAGRSCAASEKAIAFERDARLCPNCAQVYHKDHVPKTCVTCESELTGKVYQP